MYEKVRQGAQGEEDKIQANQQEGHNFSPFIFFDIALVIFSSLPVTVNDLVAVTIYSTPYSLCINLHV